MARPPANLEELLTQKEHRLRSFVGFVAAEGTRRPLCIAEIGSWLGGSAVVWHRALRDLCDGDGRIVCIDPWVPYEGKSGVGHQLEAEQNRLLAADAAFDLFKTNIAAVGAADAVEIYRGQSDDILPTLPRGGFDIVYIDGDHSYAQVRKDLENAAPLVRTGGLLCGDDLEVLYGECNQFLALKWAELGAEYVRDPATGLMFHPGVTMAVWRFFGEVSRWGLTWAMQRTHDGWRKIVLP